MFESLDAKVLAQLANLENKEALNKETKLEDITACLEQAARECQEENRAGRSGSKDYQQAALGLLAAQSIVVKWWSGDRNNA